MRVQGDAASERMRVWPRARLPVRRGEPEARIDARTAEPGRAKRARGPARPFRPREPRPRWSRGARPSLAADLGKRGWPRSSAGDDRPGRTAARRADARQRDARAMWPRANARTATNHAPCPAEGGCASSATPRRCGQRANARMAASPPSRPARWTGSKDRRRDGRAGASEASTRPGEAVQAEGTEAAMVARSAAEPGGRSREAELVAVERM